MIVCPVSNCSELVNSRYSNQWQLEIFGLVFGCFSQNEKQTKTHFRPKTKMADTIKTIFSTENKKRILVGL